MGGTYFPKNSKNGLPSFKEVLQKVYDAYQDQKTNIIKQKEIIPAVSTDRKGTKSASPKVRKFAR